MNLFIASNMKNVIHYELRIFNTIMVKRKIIQFISKMIVSLYSITFTSFYQRGFKHKVLIVNYLKFTLKQLSIQNIEYQIEQRIKIGWTNLEIYWNVQILLYYFKIFNIIGTFILNLVILGLQQFHSNMQTKQKQLQINNHQSHNLVSTKKQKQLSENEGLYRLRSGKLKGQAPKNRYFSGEKNRRSKSNNFHWTLKENLSYKKFLEKNVNLLQSDFYDRRVSKINVMMSSRIKTRTSNQCRSHHQKMLKRHKTVAGIIKFIEDIWSLNSPLKNNDRTQEEGAQIKTQNCFVQQIMVKVMEEEIKEMIQTQPKIQDLPQIEAFPLEEISSIQIEANLLYYDIQSISEYFYQKVWWDGMEI